MFKSIASWVMGKLAPLIKEIGKHHLPYTVKKCSTWHYYVLRDYIKPFDVIMSCTDGHFSNGINFSEINHIYFYLGDVEMEFDGKKEIVKGGGEYTSDGGLLDDLAHQISTKDRIVIGRFTRSMTDDEKSTLKSWAFSLLGGEYDFDMSSGNRPQYVAPEDKKEVDKKKKDFYCYSYVMRCFQNTFENIKFKISSIGGYKFITSDSFYRDPDNFKIIYDSEKHDYYMEKLRKGEN